MRSGSLLLRTFFYAPVSALLVTRISVGSFHEVLYSDVLKEASPIFAFAALPMVI